MTVCLVDKKNQNSLTNVNIKNRAVNGWPHQKDVTVVNTK